MWKKGSKSLDANDENVGAEGPERPRSMVAGTQSFAAGTLSFDDSAYPAYKTNSFDFGPSPYEDQDQEQEAAAKDVVAADMHTQAEDLEKQAAELEAAAQNCREIAQMHAYAQAYAMGQMPPGVHGMPPGGPMPHGGYGGGVPPFMPPGGMPMPWMMGPEGGPPGANMQRHHAAAASAAAAASQGNTTVMWRNIPNNYSRDILLELLDSQGFDSAYDFFYSPIDFTNNALLGYAFINFVSTDEADRFYYHFHGFTKWSLKSEKLSEVAWSHPLQGLEGHIERYRNSPVMHPDVSDEKRPVLFKDGKRIPFPHPTKKLRAPHLKECRPKGPGE